MQRRKTPITMDAGCGVATCHARKMSHFIRDWDWDWDWYPTIRTPAGCWRGDGGEGGIEVPDPDPDL